jgi:hypothetical protein
MRKGLAIICFFIFNVNLKSQPAFPNDAKYSPMYESIIDSISNTFSLEKNTDFEFRFWITTNKPYYRVQLFCLYQKNNLWKTRVFEEGWKPLNDTTNVVKYYLVEHRVPDTSQSALKKLLIVLNRNKYLTNPSLAEVKYQKKGDLSFIMCHCYYYTFELISHINKRIYSYDCPVAHSKKYKHIRIFKNIVNITKMVFEFCKLPDYRPC